MDFFLINVQEDQIVEQVQVVLYAASTIVTFILAIREWSINRVFAVTYLLTFVGLFFVTFEEISWGQRILGIDTPESIAVNNTQGEITLHNHRDIITYIDRMYIALGLLGATSWMWVHIIARRIGQLGEVIMSIVPTWWLSYYYLLPALFIAHDQYVTRNYKDWREFFELILVIGILLTVINSSKYRSDIKINA